MASAGFERQCKPFFEAVQTGRWETAKDFYIQHPEAVRVRHPSSGKTALHIAVEAGHVDIVRELVSQGVSENMEQRVSETMEQMEQDVSETMEQMEQGFEYSRCKPFFEAVQAGRWETARDFHIQHPEAVRVRHPFSGQTALHFAVEAGHVDIVRELVSLMEEDDLEIKASGDVTALAIALTNFGSNGFFIPEWSGAQFVSVEHLCQLSPLRHLFALTKEKSDVSSNQSFDRCYVFLVFLPSFLIHIPVFDFRKQISNY